MRGERVDWPVAPPTLSYRKLIDERLPHNPYIRLGMYADRRRPWLCRGCPSPSLWWRLLQLWLMPQLLQQLLSQLLQLVLQQLLPELLLKLLPQLLQLPG